MAFKYTDVVFKIGAFSKNIEGRDVPWLYGKKKDAAKTVTFTYIDKAVLNALATRADEDGTCRPGYGCIAKDTLLSRRACMDSVSKLAWLGFLSIASGDDSAYASNTYTLKMDKLCEAAGLTEEETKKKKSQRIKGKNGHTYTRKSDVTPPAEDAPCDVCGADWIECICGQKPTDAAVPPAETFNKMTCPKCEVTSMMTQQAYVNHISICTGKVKTTPPSLDVIKTASLPAPIKLVPVSPPPTPAPPVEPKVKCPMHNCTAEGTKDTLEKHMALRNNVCKECNTAYHTMKERHDCENKHVDEYNAERKAKEEAEWVAMKPWQRRAKWEKDKAAGTWAEWSSFGRWRKGEEFND